MITQLHIRNIALIQSLDLTMEAGLTTVTGETGAGKSITFDALGLLLGDRASAELIRTGSDEAQVSGIFILDPMPDTVRECLEESGIALDGAELLIRRVLSRKGTSRAWVNDTPATIQTLARLGSALVDRVGQHAQVALLATDAQRSMVDGFAAHDDLMATHLEAWRAWKETTRLLRELETATEERGSRIEFLNFQLRELEELKLRTGEYDELDRRIERARNAEKLTAVASLSMARLSDAEPSALTLLSQAADALARASVMDPDAEPLLIRARELVGMTSDLSHDLARWADRLDSEGDLDGLQARHEQIRKAMRRFGTDEEGLLGKVGAHRAEIDSLVNYEASLEKARQAANAAHRQVLASAARLEESRAEAAGRLFEAVQTSLRDLAMTRTRFEWVRTGTSLHATGMGEAEIWFAANPGQPLAPLRRTASGGELSRILLAMKVAMTSRQPVPTVVFDEVDTGIGGATADVVGRLLSSLAAVAQVICITHQPQVAAWGSAHLHASKNVSGESTTTSLRSLEGRDRVVELARMLGGAATSDAGIEHARELLEAAARGRGAA
jgi:DNA repair protein RecN (Recombination protein N)